MSQNLRQQLVNLTGLGIALLGWTLYAVYLSPTQGWTFFFQLTVNGIILGSVYALIALGYTMVYGILKLLNFAHGDVFMVGAFILLCMFLAAMTGSGFLGVAIERFAYRPLRNAPRIAPLITALGVAFFLENSMLLLFGSKFRTYNGFDLVSYNGIHIGGDNGVFVQYLGLMVIVSAVA